MYIYYRYSTYTISCYICTILLRCTQSIYVNNSLHFAQTYAQIFAHGHYLFRKANSFLYVYTQLEENCELRGRDNVQRQLHKNIFMPNGAIVFITLHIFIVTRMVLEIGEYNDQLDIPSFS